MFKNNAICQFSSLSTNKKTIPTFRPFGGIVATAAICFFYFFIIDITSSQISEFWLKNLLLFLSFILTNFLYCYIEYKYLSKFLKFVVTQDGIIQRINDIFFILPWCNIVSISKWTTPVGWEISIKSADNIQSSNNQAADFFSGSNFTVNNENKPIYIRNSSDSYLAIINNFSTNCTTSLLEEVKHFNAWKYTKVSILTNLFLIDVVSLLFALFFYCFS